jgi:ParB family transcriptional regulator, chromosome partitioning protein
MPKKTALKSATAKPRKKMALGKGLDALFPDIDTLKTPTRDFFECDTAMIHPNRYQPRRRFDKEDLESLGLSIQAQGIIQPLVVRKTDVGFELIAGERRLRAARLAGLKRVPVVVKEVNDTELLEMSIVENIQRAELNPMEEADAYQRLISEFKLTQDEAAARVGKSRPAVANMLRLRGLPADIQKDIREGHLSMGHARALLGLETEAERLSTWQAVQSRKLSVRETEQLVKKLKENSPSAPPAGTPSNDPQDFYYNELSDELARRFGTKVAIKRQGKKGRIVIDFYSDKDLGRLIEQLKQS